MPGQGTGSKQQKNPRSPDRGVGPRPGPTESSVPGPLLSRPYAALPSVAKGWGRSGITCKRSSRSRQGRSSGQPPRTATGGGPPLETTAGRVPKFPGCLGPNGRLFYLSYSAPTVAATAILGSHCGGRRGAGGLQRGQRAGRHAPSPRQRPRGGEIRLGGSRSAISALDWSHVTGGSLRCHLWLRRRLPITQTNHQELHIPECQLALGLYAPARSPRGK